MGDDQVLHEDPFGSGDAINENDLTGAGGGEESLTVVQHYDGFMEIVIRTDAGKATVYTNFARTGDTLTHSNFDIDGPGAGSLGPGRLRRFGRELGKREGVEWGVIGGGRRTTRANPGHLPRDVLLRVN